MRTFKRLLSAFLALALMLSVSVSALAATYDLTLGDIIVTTDGEGQKVIQNDTTTKDDAVVITSGGTGTSNTVQLSSSGDATVEVTFSGLVIEAVYESAVVITDGTEAVINVSGENTVSANAQNAAVIAVSDADLTITGEGGSLEVDNDYDTGYYSDYFYGTGVGSGNAQNFSGSITITGDVTVDVSHNSDFSYGASIGAGYGGDFNGEVNIADNATVNAKSSFSAGIGSSFNGDFNGQINISDSTVDGSIGALFLMNSTDLSEINIINSEIDGSIRGDSINITGSNINSSISGDSINITGSNINSSISGDSVNITSCPSVTAGSISGDSIYITSCRSVTANSGIHCSGNGEIKIIDSTVTAQAAGDVPGIGSDSNFTGTINIINSTVTASAYDGAGIGSGKKSNFNGTVNISNSTVNANSTHTGAGIGSGNRGDFNGVVNITESPRVTAWTGDNDRNTGNGYGAGIGSGSRGAFAGLVNIVGSKVGAYSDASSAGIGSGYSGIFSKNGTVTIHDSNVNAQSGKSGAAIGSGLNEEKGGGFYGTILVTGRSNLYLDNSVNHSLLGNDRLSAEIGTGTVELRNKTTLFVDRNGNWVAATLEESEDPEVPTTSKYVSARLLLMLDGPEPDLFWFQVYHQILNAREGDELTVDADWRVTMPAFIMDAIRETGVTLVIRWEGGRNIVIEEPYDGDTYYAFFYLAELNDLLSK